MAGSVSLISLNSFFMLFLILVPLPILYFFVGEDVTIEEFFAKLLLSFLSKISKIYFNLVHFSHAQLNQSRNYFLFGLSLISSPRPKDKLWPKLYHTIAICRPGL